MCNLKTERPSAVARWLSAVDVDVEVLADAICELLVYWEVLLVDCWSVEKELREELMVWWMMRLGARSSSPEENIRAS
jgi:hypothetical protein